MSNARQPKKSETIEIRVPYEAKAAFMARCREEGRTASEALRGFIDRELSGEGPPPPQGLRHTWRTALGAALGAALGGLALGAAAAPVVAHPPAASRATFERLDLNHDGVLTLQEFSAR